MVMSTWPPLQHDEVDILGLDGHIYKGRMDTRLPGIITKEGECQGAGTSTSWGPGTSLDLHSPGARRLHVSEHLGLSKRHWVRACRSGQLASVRNRQPPLWLASLALPLLCLCSQLPPGQVLLFLKLSKTPSAEPTP